MRPKNLSGHLWLKYNRYFLAEHFLGPRLYEKILGESERRLFQEVHSELENSQNQDDFIEYYDSGKSPKEFFHPSKIRLFKGAANDWGCVKKWNFDYFAKLYADQMVTIYNSPGLFIENEQSLSEISVSDYIQELRAGSKKYLKFSPIVHHNSTLRTDFDIDWLNRFCPKGSFGHKFYLFMGAAQTQTPIHNALSHTAFVQVHGKKKWSFWHPGDRLFLGVRPTRRQYFYSDAKLDEKNKEKFPLIEYANRCDVIMEPGDVLWFPSFYWHYVTNPTDSIGVAYKIAHLPSALRSSSMMTMLSFLSTRPSLLESLFSSGFKNNEAVFR